MNKYKVSQSFFVIVMIVCFGLFMYNFLTKEPYAMPLIIMFLSFLIVIVLSFFIDKMKEDYIRSTKYNKEDIIRIQAIKNVEGRLKKEGLLETTTYIEKSKLVDDEMDRLNKE